MIIKRGQPIEGMQRYVRKSRVILAKRMTEDFMVETEKDPGWDHGKSGDWLVYVGGELWAVISDSEFNKIYRRLEHDDCTGPCDDYRLDHRLRAEERNDR